MAEVQIFCTHCDYRFTVSPELAGTVQVCPHCKKEFTVIAPDIPPMEQTTNRPAAIIILMLILLVLAMLLVAMFSRRNANIEYHQKMPGSTKQTAEPAAAE